MDTRPGVDAVNEPRPGDPGAELDVAPAESALADASAPRLDFRSEVLDLVIAAALGGLAVAFWFGAAAFDESDASGIGPATFPRGLALLLGVVTLMLALHAALALRGSGPQATTVVERPAAVVLGIALVVLFPLLMTALGYYLATALWLPLFLYVAGYRKPLGILVYTAGFLAFVKVGFDMILHTPLP
jgi:putative tricarboxylic transport membrane protein